MTKPTPNSPGDVYELTLAGCLGPALRATFRPWSTASSRACTVVRTEVPADVDLVDLMADLDAQGLEVEIISVC
jgi:hypothetical protein